MTASPGGGGLVVGCRWLVPVLTFFRSRPCLDGRSFGIAYTVRNSCAAFIARQRNLVRSDKGSYYAILEYGEILSTGEGPVRGSGVQILDFDQMSTLI